MCRHFSADSPLGPEMPVITTSGLRSLLAIPSAFAASVLSVPTSQHGARLVGGKDQRLHRRRPKRVVARPLLPLQPVVPPLERLDVEVRNQRIHDVERRRRRRRRLKDVVGLVVTRR